MKLERLFVFRHAPYNSDGSLAEPLGALVQSYIDKIGAALRDKFLVSPEKTCIVCSNSVKALRTAQSMKQNIGEIPIQTHNELYSDYRTCDVKRALNTIIHYGKEFRDLIVITHLELIYSLPHAFGTEILGTYDFPRVAMLHCDGAYISIREKTCSTFRT